MDKMCYNEDTRIASYTFVTNKGEFTGYAKPCKQDEDKISRFTGIDIATTKAFIKVIKNEIRELKGEIKVLEDARKMLKQCNIFKAGFVQRKMDKVFDGLVNQRLERVEEYNIIVKETKAQLSKY